MLEKHRIILKKLAYNMYVKGMPITQISDNLTLPATWIKKWQKEEGWQQMPFLTEAITKNIEVPEELKPIFARFEALRARLDSARMTTKPKSFEKLSELLFEIDRYTIDALMKYKANFKSDITPIIQSILIVLQRHLSSKPDLLNKIKKDLLVISGTEEEALLIEAPVEDA